MVIPIAGIIGGLGASRLAYAGFGARLFKSPIIQGIPSIRGTIA